MAKNFMKNTQYPKLLRKCKSKLQWDIISPNVECLLFKNAGKQVRENGTLIEFGGKINSCNFHGKLYGDFFKKVI
jgi:hypothetical protein